MTAESPDLTPRESDGPSPEFEAKLFLALVEKQRRLGRMPRPTPPSPPTPPAAPGALVASGPLPPPPASAASIVVFTLGLAAFAAAAGVVAPRSPRPVVEASPAARPLAPSSSPSPALLAASPSPTPVAPLPTPSPESIALAPSPSPTPTLTPTPSPTPTPAPSPSPTAPAPTPSPESAPPSSSSTSGPPVLARWTPESLAAPADAPLAKVLPDGSTLFLDRGARAAILGERRLRLERGRALLEVAPGVVPFRAVGPTGEAIAHGTKLVLDAAGAGLGVAVAQGLVELRGAQGAPVFLGSGDAGQAAPDKPATATASPRLSHVAAWAREVYEGREARPLSARPSVASLVAVDPQVGRPAPLDLRTLDVDVHVEDGVARTTLDATFLNPTSLRLEGSYRFPVPPGASITRLAMYVDGRLMEGGVAERERARDVFESIEHQRRDPALLEWLEGNVFKMRIFPIEPRSEKRILVSFTQPLESVEGTLRYALPLEAPGACGRFAIQVRVKGGAATPWDSSTYALDATPEGEDLVLRHVRTDYRPARDLVLSLDDPSSRAATASVATCREDGRGRYVRLRFRPKFPEVSVHGARAPRHLALVLDASARVGPRERAREHEVLARLLAELDDQDLVRVSLVNTRVHAWSEGWRPARDPATARAALAFLDGARTIGATDLGAALVEASAALDGKPGAHLVYVGAGLATIGEREPAALAALVPASVPFVGIGVGKRVDASTLETLAGATGGLSTLLGPDEPVAWRLFDLVAALATPRISGLQVRGVVLHGEPAHGELVLERPVAALGEEIRVLGRFDGRLPDRIVLEGRLGGALWSASIPVEGAREGAVYLPRLWARGRVETLIRMGAASHHDEIVALGTRYFLATPFTSLLVLESDAQYDQYHVVRGAVDPFATYPAPAQVVVSSVEGEEQARVAIAKACAAGAPWPGEGELLRSVAGLEDVVQASEEGEVSELDLPSDKPSDRTFGLSLGRRGGVPLAMDLPMTATPDINGNVTQALHPPRPSSSNKFIGAPQERFLKRGRDELRVLSSRSAKGHDYFFKKYEAPSFQEREKLQRIELTDGFTNDFQYLDQMGSLPFSFGTGITVEDAELRDEDEKKSGTRALTVDDRWRSVLRRGGGGVGNDIGFGQRVNGNYLIAGKTIGGADVDGAWSGPRASVMGGAPFFGSSYLGGRLEQQLREPTRPEATFADLLAFAPAFQASLADLAALVDRELPAPAGSPSVHARHEAEAMARLEKARAWFGVRHFVLDGPEANLEGVAAGDGRLAARTILPIGLEERLVARLDSLETLYPELGIAARRPRSRFHEADLAQAAPFLLPTASSLDACDVTVSGETGVAITEARVEGEAAAPVRVELVFSAEGRLLERRVVRTRDGSVALRHIFEASAVRTEIDGRESRVRGFSLAPAPGRDAELGPDTSKLLVLDVPARSTAFARARLGLAKSPEERRHALAQLAFSETFEARPAPEGVRGLLALDHGPGVLVLAAASRTPLGSELAVGVLIQARWELGGSRVLDYLAALETKDPEERIAALRRLARTTPTGLVPDVARFAAAWFALDRADVHAGGADVAGDPGLRAERLRRACDLAFSFAERTRDAGLAFALAERASGLDLNLTSDQDAAVVLYEIAARSPSLLRTARLRQISLLATHGRHDEAVDRFEAFAAACMARGERPPLSSDAHVLFGRLGTSGLARYFGLVERTLAWAEARHDGETVVAVAATLVRTADVEVAARAVRRLPADASPRALALVRALVEPIAVGQTGGPNLYGLDATLAAALVRDLLARPDLGRAAWLHDVASTLAGNRGELATAAAEAARAAELAAKSPDGWVAARAEWFGRVLDVLRRLAEARRAPGAPVDGELAARILALGDEAAERGVDERLANVSALALLACGAADDAWDAGSSAIERNPEEAQGYTGLAEVFLQAGDLERAARLLASAAAAEPTDPNHLVAEAKVRERLGEWAEARALLERVAGGNWQDRFASVVSQAKGRLAVIGVRGASGGR